MADHPTLVLMHNPQALRVEYRLDDQRLELWWSPRAGSSTDCADRNFSNRDDHLDVFDRVELLGFGLEGFQGCDYDPYHCCLRWTDRELHLALLDDSAVLLLWSSATLRVRFKGGRYDEQTHADARCFALLHREPRDNFRFAAQLGAGAGSFKHCAVHAAGNSHYALAEAAPEQLLAIGVGLEEDAGLSSRLAQLVARGAVALEAERDARLEMIEALGRIVAPQHPALEELRRCVVRGLHSMIDESGAFRASIKAIYYLIWVRDAGFSFAYQEAAGWPHLLRECVRLLLDNPTTAQGEGLPPGRMFAQLINRDYGKYEEDGAYYVIWLLFTAWTNGGCNEAVSEDDLALLREAVSWVEAVVYDEARGLFGEHFADESPTQGARDQGYDYAIGRPDPSPGGAIRFDDQPILRCYDIYINLLMHSAYTMLAALHGQEQGQVFSDKAAVLWTSLEPLLTVGDQGLPMYGELLLADGRRVMCPHWGPASSVYVWALAMPAFAPCDHWDAMRRSLLQVMMDKPRMHWINGICAAVAAVDPWCADERELLDVIVKVQEESDRPGPYLPMGGAMPEKFDAPQGNLYHDIRPQGFAMGAWLGAWASLGLRRLPYGLALRPTRAFERIERFAWCGRMLDLHFASISGRPGLSVNGQRVAHSLQIPHDLLNEGDNQISLSAGAEGPLLLRSTLTLCAVESGGGQVTYRCQARGLSELVFAEACGTARVLDAAGVVVESSASCSSDGLGILRFTAWGEVRICC